VIYLLETNLRSDNWPIRSVAFLRIFNDNNLNMLSIFLTAFLSIYHMMRILKHYMIDEIISVIPCSG
jgi:hypothetical protein